MFKPTFAEYGLAVATETRSGLIASPRAVASFLTTVKPIMHEVNDSRAHWIRDIGVLLEDARRQHVAVVAQGAIRVGRAQVLVFREAHTRVAAISRPTDCEVIHRAVLMWLDKQISACDVMVDLGARGDLTRLHEVQGLLAEGRVHAQKFNEEFVRLVALVRLATRDAVAQNRTKRINAANRQRRRGSRD